MEILVLHVLPVVGWPIYFILLGLVLDFTTAGAFKALAVQWVRRQQPISSFIGVLRLFLDDFLGRLVGKHPEKLSFFLKSSALSLLFVVLIGFAQSTLHYPEDQTFLISTYVRMGVAPLVTLILANMLVDYVSNVVTLACVRMAALSGNPLDVLVSILADVALTITLFTLIFPIGLVLCSTVIESTTPAVTMQLTKTPNNPSLDYMLDATYRYQPLLLFPTLPEGDPTSQTVFVVAPKESSTDQIVRSAAWLLTDGQQEPQLTFKDAAVFSAKVPVEVSDLKWWAAKYYGAFSSTNELRDELFSMINFHPLVISLSTLYEAADKYYGDMTEEFVRCENNVFKKVIIKRGSLNELVRKGVEVCGGKIVAAIAPATGAKIHFQLRKAVTEDINIPVAIFFLTSFTLSILYYISIAVTYAGLKLDVLVNKLFSTQFLKTDQMPFLFLGSLVFLLVEAVRFLLALLL
jgi:hypothetical protein